MKPRFTLLFLLLALSAPVLAQPEQRTVTWQWLGWYHLEERLRFAPRWEASLELEDNRFRFFSAEHQYSGRVSLLRKLGDDFTAGAGFAYFGQRADSLTAFDDPLATELRPHQEIIHRRESGSKKWTYRLRIEQRLFRDVTERRVTDNYDFNLRVRLLTQWNHTLNPGRTVDDRKLELVFYDEIMVNRGAGVSHWFNQNRLYAGLSRQLSKAFTVEGGYLLILQQRASGGRFWGRNVVRFALVHEWRMGKAGG